MSDFADLLAPQALDLNGSGMTFVDADTLRDADDNRYRIQGIDAPEIAKLDQEGIPGWQGTAGGGVATPTLINLANDYGYTNVVKTGEFDPHGREIVRLQDKDGRDFANQVLKSGLLETNRYTTHQLTDLSRDSILLCSITVSLQQPGLEYLVSKVSTVFIF